MVGKEYEEQGIIKDGAKMVQAVATADVPKFTLVGRVSRSRELCRCAAGAYGPRFSLPGRMPGSGHRGAQQAAQVLVTVKQQQ